MRYSDSIFYAPLNQPSSTWEIKFVVGNLAEHRRHDGVVQMIDPGMHVYLGIIAWV
jgi:hypothetical protein